VDEPTGDPAVLETHLSRLFFVGDRVYKCAKAIDLGFVDHRAIAARARCCADEVEVNRRFAPDVYTGTAVLVGPDGNPAEHFVVMRRLPWARRLSALLRDVDADDHVREVARAVAVIHARSPRSADIDRFGSLEHVTRLWDDNLRELQPFAGTALSAEDLAVVEHHARRYLAGRAPLFAARVAAGCTCDGHGDLLADDIFCLPDGPRILDALAFRSDLRCGDVLLDVAFLAMDLERLGHPGHARRFLLWYQEFSGETFPDSLAAHYVAYRALVRAKIGALRWSQTEDPAAAREAQAHLGLARQHLERARVRLVLVGGLPGTGKSTLADALAAATGWVVLRTDEIRRELVADVPNVLNVPDVPNVPSVPSDASDASAASDPHRDGAYGVGRYAPEARSVVYAHLLARARELLERGETVVLDGSWSEATHRSAAYAVAGATTSDIVELQCVAPAAVAERRLAERQPAASHGSEATAEIRRRMAQTADPWPTAVLLDTAGPVEETVATALALCRVASGPLVWSDPDQGPRQRGPTTLPRERGPWSDPERRGNGDGPA
jgi:aminoglycoside phosphotransferase family enzyme/predicted kinase